MGIGARAVLAGVAALAVLVASGRGGRASAQGDQWIAVFDLPGRDTAPQVRGAHLEVVALGYPDDRFKRLAPRRASAEAQGERRGIRSLHDFVDETLATVQVHPRIAARLHRTVNREASRGAVRPLLDGSAVVQMRVSLAALREAAPALTTAGVPW